MPIELSERDPRVPADRLVGELVPPPRFAEVSFDSYRPDPHQPTQQHAVEALRGFAATIGVKPRRATRVGRKCDKQIGLGFVVLVEPNGGVVSKRRQAGRLRDVIPEPPRQDRVRLPVARQPNR